MVFQRRDEEKRRRRDARHIYPRFVFGEEFDGLQRDLVLPVRRVRFRELGEERVGVGRRQCAGFAFGGRHRNAGMGLAPHPCRAVRFEPRPRCRPVIATNETARGFEPGDQRHL